ncbi:restriction endonuclease subunit S [Blastococcus sp. TF02A-30]|uniref:restriction endonuclease subunit S n=1 Tax=Blastococcus sp. TF02A-30 TaxID=2250580 RepID=UPI000DE8EDF1|nr:restriction endonuclease subunit S [Blastococcus sp. TF02A-30]RBY92703.1 hypothetical protein DQ241_01100 [Blastococcus sp. TF02A-30]
MNDLPDGWRWAVLDELKAAEPGAITDGPFGSKLTSAHYSSDGARVVRLQNIGEGVYRSSDAFIPWSHFEGLRKHEVRADDLLIASLGEDPPRACLAPATLGAAIVKADCVRVRLSDEVDPRWVMYAMQNPALKRWAAEQLHGVGRPRLGLKTIRHLPIPVPSFDEQRRIVVLLEDYLSRLDAAKDMVAAGVRRLDALTVASLQREANELRVRGVEFLPLGEVAETRLGKMLDSKRATGTPTPYLRNINVRWGSVDTSDVKSVSLSEAERQELALRPGDLLVCEGGEPGRCAIWPGSDDLITFQKALHRVRVDPGRLTPEFAAAMLEATIRTGDTSAMFTGTTIKHLPQERLRGMLMPVPPLDEQRRLVAQLRATGERAARLRQELRLLQLRSSSLRRALLGAAFSGQLTGRSSDVEVVEEMAEAAL